jgi:hypothetical protein
VGYFRLRMLKRIEGSGRERWFIASQDEGAGRVGVEADRRGLKLKAEDGVCSARRFWSC